MKPDPAEMDRLRTALTRSDPALLPDAIRSMFFPRIGDIWSERDEPTVSLVLLVSGINQEQEVAIASSILVWKEFLAKDAARLRCIDSSDRLFPVASKHFGVTRYPTLAFAIDKSLGAFLTFDPELLLAISQEDGAMQRFLTKLRSSVEAGASLDDLRNELRADRLWAGFKVAYHEAKEWFR